MWRVWNAEQRVAAVAASLLIVSTLGPFSWVELAIVLVGVGVLLLLRRRAQGRPFHLPFGDGIVIAAAGAWSAFLILIRLFDRPLGQGMLALACAGLLFAAGIRERARRPMDDLPREQDTLWEERPARRPGPGRPRRGRGRTPYGPTKSRRSGSRRRRSSRAWTTRTRTRCRGRTTLPPPTTSRRARASAAVRAGVA